MSTPITVLIVDDYEIVRNGIHYFLDTQPDFEVIGEAGSGQEAIEIVMKQIPDIVLLDLTMPDMDGIQTTLRIKKISPRTQVVILSASMSDQFCFPALRAGAISYLMKDIKMDQLAGAIRCAARGEAMFHPHIAARILQHLRGEQSDSDLFLSSLSDREMDVLRLIACGLTNCQIAQKLQISENTVKGHVGNIRAKLQIADRVHLAVFAWENGIASPQGMLCDASKIASPLDKDELINQ
jgi:two-component system, NarL family, response regulator LiaR